VSTGLLARLAIAFATVAVLALLALAAQKWFQIVAAPIMVLAAVALCVPAKSG
jgi:hypothetical protein